MKWGGGRATRVLPIHGEVAAQRPEGPTVEPAWRGAGGAESLTSWLALGLMLGDGAAMTARRTRVTRRMRKSLNLTESWVWSRLRGRQLEGWKFRRQQPIGPYYVDFYCPAARLVVEIDGPNHDFDERWAYDQRRQAWLEAEGYRVLRINIDDPDVDLDEVIDCIYVELTEREQLGFTQRPHRPAAPGTSP